MKEGINTICLIIIFFFFSCKEEKAALKEDQSSEWKANSIRYSQEDGVFSFYTFGDERAIFPLVDELEKNWGPSTIYPAKLERKSFEEFFMDEKELDNPLERGSTGLSYNYLYRWDGIKYPISSNSTNSIAILIYSYYTVNPEWDELFPEGWDSVFKFKAVIISRVSIRISKDGRKKLSLSSEDVDEVINRLQGIVERKVGPAAALSPSKEYVNSFMERDKLKKEIRKRLPAEMRKGYWPLVGFPKDRREIDLRLSFSYPISKKINYSVQLRDSLKQLIDHQLIVRNNIEYKELDKITVRNSNSDYKLTDVYVYHILLEEPHRVKNILFVNDEGEKFLIHKEGEPITSGFTMEEFSVESLPPDY